MLTIDSCPTVIQAVVIDLDWGLLAATRQNVSQNLPVAKHVEREITAFREQIASD